MSFVVGLLVGFVAPLAAAALCSFVLLRRGLSFDFGDGEERADIDVGAAPVADHWRPEVGMIVRRKRDDVLCQVFELHDADGSLLAIPLRGGAPSLAPYADFVPVGTDPATRHEIDTATAEYSRELSEADTLPSAFGRLHDEFARETLNRHALERADRLRRLRDDGDAWTLPVRIDREFAEHSRDEIDARAEAN